MIEHLLVWANCRRIHLGWDLAGCYFRVLVQRLLDLTSWRWTLSLTLVFLVHPELDVVLGQGNLLLTLLDVVVVRKELLRVGVVYGVLQLRVLHLSFEVFARHLVVGLLGALLIHNRPFND